MLGQLLAVTRIRSPVWARHASTTRQAESNPQSLLANFGDSRLLRWSTKGKPRLVRRPVRDDRRNKAFSQHEAASAAHDDDSQAANDDEGQYDDDDDVVALPTNADDLELAPLNEHEREAQEAALQNFPLLGKPGRLFDPRILDQLADDELLEAAAEMNKIPVFSPGKNLDSVVKPVTIHHLPLWESAWNFMFVNGVPKVRSKTFEELQARSVELLLQSHQPRAKLDTPAEAFLQMFDGFDQEDESTASSEGTLKRATESSDDIDWLDRQPGDHLISDSSAQSQVDVTDETAGADNQNDPFAGIDDDGDDDDDDDDNYVDDDFGESIDDVVEDEVVEDGDDSRVAAEFGEEEYDNSVVVDSEGELSATEEADEEAPAEQAATEQHEVAETLDLWGAESIYPEPLLKYFKPRPHKPIDALRAAIRRGEGDQWAGALTLSDKSTPLRDVLESLLQSEDSYRDEYLVPRPANDVDLSEIVPQLRDQSQGLPNVGPLAEWEKDEFDFYLHQLKFNLFDAVTLCSASSRAARIVYQTKIVERLMRKITEDDVRFFEAFKFDDCLEFLRMLNDAPFLPPTWFLDKLWVNMFPIAAGPIFNERQGAEAFDLFHRLNYRPPGAAEPERLPANEQDRAERLAKTRAQIKDEIRSSFPTRAYPLLQHYRKTMKDQLNGTNTKVNFFV